MRYPKMTGKAGQQGVTLLEVVIALTIVVVVTTVISRLTRDNQSVANDMIAKLAVQQARVSAASCWNVYGHTGATVSTDPVSNERSIQCSSTTSTGSSTVSVSVYTIPQGVNLTLETTENKTITRLGAFHESGTQGSDGSRTTFCLTESNGHEAISAISASASSGGEECSDVSVH